MKRCPQCGREYDNTMMFCLDDGSELLYGPASSGARMGDADEQATAILHSTAAPGEAPTRAQIPNTDATAILPNAADKAPSPTVSRKNSLVAGVLGIILVTALGVGSYLYYGRGSAKQINSIAVMPFENRNSDADTDYLSDGLAESVIFRLTQLPDLRVSPTSSVMRYKGKETDIAKIANELGVDAVMTGRLTKRGDNLNITVELVDTRTNKSLWGEQYERKLSELLTTQREIAAEITNKLQLKLSGESEQKLAKRYTENNEAYQLYLKGRFHWARRTKDESLRAVDYYRQAIALDPKFALAYVGVADAFNSIGKDPHLSPKEAIPQAKSAALKALEIDPALAEAHAALGDSLAIYDWNWTESEREFNRALELNPNVAYTHVVYGTSLLVPTGRIEEAVARLKRSVELEPLTLINNAVLVTVYLYARQNDRALEQARKTYDLDRNFTVGRFWLGQAYIANGMYTDAIALGEEGLKQSPSNAEMLSIIAQGYAKSGKRREAEDYIGRMKELAKTQYVRTYWLARVYSALGDKDKALAELEQSFADKDVFLPRMKCDPMLDELRDDPRFKDLLKRMGLPE